MARIAGVDLPRNKRIEVALTYIFGIGRSSARQILKSTGIDNNTEVKDLTEREVNALRTEIDTNYRVEGELRQEVRRNVRRLIDIGSYRGLRHRRNLPVRGQRTRTNARTRKGPNKRKVGIGKRKKEA